MKTSPPNSQMDILAKLVELMDAGATDTSSEVAALYAEFHKLDEDTAENIDPRIITRWALDNYDPMHLREMNHQRKLDALMETKTDLLDALDNAIRELEDCADHLNRRDDNNLYARNAIETAKFCRNAVIRATQ